MAASPLTASLPSFPLSQTAVKLAAQQWAGRRRAWVWRLSARQATALSDTTRRAFQRPRSFPAQLWNSNCQISNASLWLPVWTASFPDWTIALELEMVNQTGELDASVLKRLTFTYTICRCSWLIHDSEYSFLLRKVRIVDSSHRTFDLIARTEGK